MQQVPAGAQSRWKLARARPTGRGMALFSQCLEPVGFLQSLRSLALGVVSHLQGSATAEELAFVRKEVELLERELAAGPGLLEDGGLDACEDCVAAAFGQLCLAVRAAPPAAPLETELFVQGCMRDKLERRLLVLWRRLQGNAVLSLQRPLLEQAVQRHRPRRPEMALFCQKLNAVLGAGLLCLLCQAGLAKRDSALLMGVWDPRVAALHKRMKEALGQCKGYFRQQAQEDVERALEQAAPPDPAELATSLLRQLEQNYDWLCWAVMAWWSEGEVEGEVGSGEVLAQGSFVSAHTATGLHLVACYQESPLALDRARTNQLIGELEWKLPNPPPEVYASLEAEPARARGYLARRMLQKLAEGLGPGVTLLVVPGKLEMKSSFPLAASLLHEYHHRLASGTVCIFG
ncbi:uncharacterized protein LOC113450431 [Pseudonaja textilis]|uniref:Uncharacterized LOC113450431 n=1 Tax=Pseudonaja textilis TaxID=8673 RepID=A0A670Z6T7_PSETE|nr:uncharacterized protein LOC113450431 [Pseudonaja textilis]